MSMKVKYSTPIVKYPTSFHDLEKNKYRAALVSTEFDPDQNSKILGFHLGRYFYNQQADAIEAAIDYWHGNRESF